MERFRGHVAFCETSSMPCCVAGTRRNKATATTPFHPLFNRAGGTWRTKARCTAEKDTRYSRLIELSLPTSIRLAALTPT